MKKTFGKNKLHLVTIIVTCFNFNTIFLFLFFGRVYLAKKSYRKKYLYYTYKKYPSFDYVIRNVNKLEA